MPIETLIDWVNILWFSNLFDYNDKECDSIASVLNNLEELDEKGKIFSDSDIEKYINALSKNEEVD